MQSLPGLEPLISAAPSRVDVFTTFHKVTRAGRADRFGHRGGVVWLTGLSGAGKSTLAMETEQLLFELGWTVFVLDGDNVRSGLSADLGFSPADRIENIRRITEVAALFRDAGLICITAFISPYAADRECAKTSIGERDFLEVYVRADLATCERRDPKGLYAKARRGEIKDFTGISSAYEPPASPDAVVDTVSGSIAACAESLASEILHRFGKQ